MNAVLLDCVWNVHQVLVDHRNKSGVVFCGKIAKYLIESAYVIRTVIGRKGDPGKQNLDVSALQGVEHLIEIAAGLFEGQAA